MLIETHRQLLIDFAHLELRRKISTGKQASMFSGLLRSNKVVAVKVYTPQHFTEEVVGEFSHEAALCAAFSHPNIVEFYGMCICPPTICLVYELCAYTLEDVLTTRGKYLEHRRTIWLGQSHDGNNGDSKLELQRMQLNIAYMLDCSRAVAYVHSFTPPFLHRDIKPANFQLDTDNNLKLTDFSDSRRLPSEIPISTANSSCNSSSSMSPAFAKPKMTVTGTVDYMAPELINSRTGLAAYAEAADIYSLAITFWDMLYPDREKYPNTYNNHLLVFEGEKGRFIFLSVACISQQLATLDASRRKIMALNVLDRNTRDVMAASYAIPDLETAVQQVIYNAIDARAKTIRLMVNVADASFSAVDDGDGIQPDDLHKFIGECFASSRVSQLVPTEKQQKAYGSRGAFLHEMIALAKVVEIESRVQDHWASWRKVFKEGKVSFNAASKQTRQAPGTKVCVSDLFGKLPVRRKDLLHNRKYRRHVIQNIYSFCVNMSMIWPSLSLDIQYEGEEVRPVIISAVKSCSERFQTHFGPVLGKELHYVTFSSKRSEFSIRGYFAFVPRGCEGLAQGIKQAKSYYQFAFLENQWVGECQQICSRVITDAALEYLAAIPIFVVKVAVPNDEHDILRFKTEGRVLFKAPEEFQNFLVEFVQSLTSPTENDHEASLLFCLKYDRLKLQLCVKRAVMQVLAHAK
ncbi:TKL protein kinase [Phytophthora cinnamomi]|uniref:TKL protein kinase n=1 Tax=Phytophthora cinnamomi TaxID=4785 RepID=UPI00355A5F0A|nr:TKL protein kinase [Phytophthora cinnamomi]